MIAAPEGSVHRPDRGRYRHRRAGDDLPYIFDRFTESTRRARASGGSVRLSIVRATVLENGGTISAQRRQTAACV